MGSLVGVLGVAGIWAFLIFFLIYPLCKLFVDGFTGSDGRWSFTYLSRFVSDPFYLRALFNSTLLALAVVFATSVIGFYAAYVNTRFNYPGRRLFSYLTIVPIIMPPLVGIMGFIFILGRVGTLNVILQEYLGLADPINFMYGLHGVILAETFHLFPLMMLNISVGLNKIDPSVEESAEIFGISGLRRIFTITFPLTTPAYCAGVLLVFTWTFADFATPLVVGIQDLVAPQAYLGVVQYVDQSIYRMGIFLSVVMVVFAVMVLVVLNRVVGMKDYTSLSYSKVERKDLSPLARCCVVASMVLIVTIAFIPYLGLLFAAFGRGWALSAIPEVWTLENFRVVLIETPKYVKNTFLYAGLAALICVMVGVPAAWIQTRTRIPGRKLMDSLTTLILAIPGAALGIAYIRAFGFPMPFIHMALYTFWIIMPIVLAVRRLPFTVRSTHSSLLLIHASYEEAAESVGAKKVRIFRDITLPLIWKGALVGSLFSFMTSVQEASATILLALEGWETLAVGIFEFYIGGTLSQAAALGIILIFLSALTLFVIHRLAGGREGGGIFG
jgi:iron(III) transport system permease protein